ncbi:unnamed protein product [Ambrosiozyma monospora]|uniref:Unnamed protein product n=1 Tax=Ambrosiozyma monospora TaxID=43982 RepID=A0ACB5U9M3_AMBMO|nr:unnamed protein product [Ambrosiozyma monospora]
MTGETINKKRDLPERDHSDSSPTKKHQTEKLPCDNITTDCDQSERDDDSNEITLTPNDDSGSGTRSVLGLEKQFPDLSDEDLELYISLKLDDKKFMSLVRILHFCFHNSVLDFHDLKFQRFQRITNNFHIYILAHKSEGYYST